MCKFSKTGKAIDVSYIDVYYIHLWVICRAQLYTTEQISATALEIEALC